MENKIMTPEEFKQKMLDIKNDPENATEDIHYGMDIIMCNLLESLGYGDGVKVFCETYKWYA